MTTDFGYFFKKRTGVDPADCANILEIEKIVEANICHPLKINTYPSALVASSGNIFPVSDRHGDLEAEIDKELSRLNNWKDRR